VIKLVLLVGLVAVGLAILRKRNSRNGQTSASKKLLLGLFAVGFVISVMFPEFTTVVANKLGVGRGADLVLYLLVLAFVFFTLNVYLKFRDARYQLGELARWVAVTEAARDLPPQGDGPSPTCDDPHDTAEPST
jgi:hypothetical protein